MSMTTTYTGIRIADFPDLGAFTDTSSVVGEHAGSGRFDAIAVRDYVANYTIGATAGTGRFWTSDTPPARVARVIDRMFVGGAAVVSDGRETPVAKSWLDASPAGWVGVTSQMITLSTIGGVGITGAARTSDEPSATYNAAVGVVGYALNDITVSPPGGGAWGFYGHAVRGNSGTGSAFAMEVEIANVGSVVDVSAYGAAQPGMTVGHLIGSGGEQAIAGPVNPASAAIVIISEQTRNATARTGALFDKGIVFQADAIAGTDGSTGTAVAIEMGKGHTIRWQQPGGAGTPAGYIRSDLSSTAAITGMVFNNTGIAFYSLVSPGFASENPIFLIEASNTAVNYLAMGAGNAGTPPGVFSVGADTDIDLFLGPKAAGLVWFATAPGVATTPSNFSPQNYLAIKAGSGSTYYVPCHASPW